MRESQVRVLSGTQKFSKSERFIPKNGYICKEKLKHGTYTLRLIRGWKVNRSHVGSIPTVPTKRGVTCVGAPTTAVVPHSMESNPWRRRDLFAKQCDRWETDCGSLPLLSSTTRMIRDQSWLISDFRVVRYHYTGLRCTKCICSGERLGLPTSVPKVDLPTYGVGFIWCL